MLCLILPPRWLSIYILCSSIKLICSRSSFPHMNTPSVQFFCCLIHGSHSNFFSVWYLLALFHWILLFYLFQQAFMHVGTPWPVLFNGKLIACHIVSMYQSSSIEQVRQNRLHRVFSHFKWESKSTLKHREQLHINTSLHIRVQWEYNTNTCFCRNSLML